MGSEINYNHLSGIFCVIDELWSKSPSSSPRDIAEVLNIKGYRKKNGSEFKASDVTRTFRKWSARKRQIEMIETKRRLKNG